MNTSLPDPPGVTSAHGVTVKAGAYLMRFAAIAAGIAIIVAPFRGSAGLRGAMWVLAGVAILLAHWRASKLPQLVPPYKLLGIATLLWLLVATAWSFVSPSPMESLSVMKRDILTPILACLVFYALTRSRADMMRWLTVLTLGIVVLSAMVIREPFNPRATTWNADYTTVGFLSTWVVTLAPLLALLLFARPAQNSRARVLLVIALPCLLICAWLSGNRTVWVCLALMVAASMLLGAYGRIATRLHRRSNAMLLGLVVVLVSILMAALQYRAQTQATPGTSAFAFLLNDNRAPILRVTADMIGEHPWRGYGYANPEIGDAFPPRLEGQWLKTYVTHAHNLVLNYTLQMGVSGGVAILVLLAALLWTFVTRVPLDGLARLAGICGVALVVGVFLRNMTDDFFSRHTAQFFGAAIGMLLGLATHRPPLLAKGLSLRKYA
ncbi:MAG: O-antigen ligase family protein [Usitatibacteraceae bacterium]